MLHGLTGITERSDWLLLGWCRLGWEDPAQLPVEMLYHPSPVFVVVAGQSRQAC